MTTLGLERQSDVNLLLFHAPELPQSFFRLSPSSKRRLIYSGYIKTRMTRPGHHTARLTPEALAVIKAEQDAAPIIHTVAGEQRRLRK